MSEDDVLAVAHEVKEQMQFDRASVTSLIDTDPEARRRANEEGYQSVADSLEVEVREKINNGEMRDAILAVFRQRPQLDPQQD